MTKLPRNARVTYACAAMALLLLVPLRRVEGQATRAAHDMELDRVVRTFILAEQLEVHANNAERPIDFELVSWIGGDYQRVFLRAQGEQSTLRYGGGELQGDALYGRLITPYWSVVAGARMDTRLRSDEAVGLTTLSAGTFRPQRRLTRGLLAIGFIGLSPGWFEAEPTLLVSDRGDVSFEFESSIDLLFTQRLIVQPWLELNAAVQAVPEIGVSSGLNDIEIGARLRYEIRRKFAPYLGISLLRRTGKTFANTHNVSEPRNVGTIAAGVRIWR